MAWVGVLGEPVRLRLYRYVAARGVPVGRAEAAEAAGIQRTLAAFHLDRLAEAGLLDVVYRRTSGRAGPGAGRPAKLYLRSPEEHSLSLPPRAYDAAAEVFAEAIEAAGAEPELHAAARAHGEREGRAARHRLTSAAATQDAEGAAAMLCAALAERGYEPYTDQETGTLRLRNCPFHRIARDFPPLTCGMNHELLAGFVAGAGARGVSVRMDPRPGECCVAIATAATSGTRSKNNND
ncbi:MAG: transcriptional regulator [Streptosporangiales bacterium]|nr:transcriptional regulator [Streptosporangiales bacterium]